MSVDHKFPSETRDCIVSDDQVCKFFNDRRKNEKAVFIAAPYKLKLLTEVTKKVVKDFGYEPLVATEVREYNRTAFCNNICRPMLESWIVVVIGDWKGNQGNVNVAFEYGIATALGCEIVPVRVHDKEGGPFDMSGLHTILVGADTLTTGDTTAFEKEFREYFEKSKSRLELLKAELRLSDSDKARLQELLEQFSTDRTPEQRRITMAVIKRFSQVVPVHRDCDFVKSMANLAGRYAILYARPEASGVGLTKECLDENFFDLLGASIMMNVTNPECTTIGDGQFHNALAALARCDGVPGYARRTAVSLLIVLAGNTGNKHLLSPIIDVIRNEKLSDQEYDALGIPSMLLNNYVGTVISRGGSLKPILDHLSTLRDTESTKVQARLKQIDQMFKR